MNKSIQVDLQYLSSTYSKMLKRKFGKGPETCYGIQAENCFFLYIRNFITPAEEVLLSKNKLDIAIQFRSAIMHSVTEEFIQEAADVLNISFDSFYFDWNYKTNMGMVLLEKSDPQLIGDFDWRMEDGLRKLFDYVGSRHHKMPQNMQVVNINQSSCAIKASGIVSSLEKSLYEQGKTTILFHNSSKIKADYLEQRKLFEEVFNREIEDMFILWDYKQDRNYFIFHFTRIQNTN